jgi:hypothetical protein
MPSALRSVWTVKTGASPALRTAPANVFIMLFDLEQRFHRARIAEDGDIVEGDAEVLGAPPRAGDVDVLQDADSADGEENHVFIFSPAAVMSRRLKTSPGRIHWSLNSCATCDGSKSREIRVARNGAIDGSRAMGRGKKNKWGMGAVIGAAQSITSISRNNFLFSQIWSRLKG